MSSIISTNNVVLDRQHHELLATLDNLLRLLKQHAHAEDELARLTRIYSTPAWKSHQAKHQQFHDNVRGLKKGLIAHINHDDYRDMHFAR